MKFKVILVLFGISIFFSTSSSALVINNLSYDGSKIVTDTVTGRQYLGLDVLVGLSYQQTVGVISSGGAWEGWSIANTKVADEFIDALLGGSNACSYNGTFDSRTLCGASAQWTDGLLGDNFIGSQDLFTFLADEYSLPGYAGLGQLYESYGVFQQEAWIEINATQIPAPPHYSWLVYRNNAPVPEPSILALMFTGILGLGIARRKRK